MVWLAEWIRAIIARRFPAVASPLESIDPVYWIAGRYHRRTFRAVRILGAKHEARLTPGLNLLIYNYNYFFESSFTAHSLSA
jgi:hypothetical protein